MLLFTWTPQIARLSNYLHGLLAILEPSVIYMLSYLPPNTIICMVFAPKPASFRATTQNHNIYMLLDTYSHQTSLFTCFQTPHVIYRHCVTVSRCVTAHCVTARHKVDKSPALRHSPLRHRRRHKTSLFTLLCLGDLIKH